MDFLPCMENRLGLQPCQRPRASSNPLEPFQNSGVLSEPLEPCQTHWRSLRALSAPQSPVGPAAGPRALSPLPPGGDQDARRRSASGPAFPRPPLVARPPQRAGIGRGAGRAQARCCYCFAGPAPG